MHGKQSAGANKCMQTELDKSIYTCVYLLHVWVAATIHQCDNCECKY